MKKDIKLKKKKTNLKNSIEQVKKKNFNLMLLVTFFLGVLLIFSAYAWFYSSLDVQVKFVNLVVSKKNGLFISLDGIEFGSSVEISEESLINGLKNRYPGNTSQWARGGLYPISSKGIPNSNTSNLEFYVATGYEADPLTGKSYLSTRKTEESIIIADNIEIVVLEVGKDRVKLGVTAPKDVKIIRNELRKAQDANLESSKAVSKAAIDAMLKFKKKS